MGCFIHREHLQDLFAHRQLVQKVQSISILIHQILNHFNSTLSKTSHEIRSIPPVKTTTVSIPISPNRLHRLAKARNSGSAPALPWRQLGYCAGGPTLAAEPAARGAPERRGDGVRCGSWVPFRVKQSDEKRKRWPPT